MPWKTTKDRIARDAKGGKSDSTQAGELVREQMSKLKRGKGRPKSRKQAIAIGLSQARKAGKKVPARGASRKTSRAKGARKGGTTRRATGTSRSKSGSRSRSRS